MKKGRDVFSPFDARQHWKRVRASWEKVAEEVGKEIEKIEDPVLRQAVLRLFAATTSGKGEFLMVYKGETVGNGGGFEITAFDIDNESFDALEAEFGADFNFDPAHEWIVKCVNGLPAPFVAWALGPINLQPFNGLTPEQQAHVHFSHDRIVFSAGAKTVIGVLSHPEPNRQGCHVIPIDF